MVSSLPESIGLLTSLKKLTLRRNGLKKLPNSMNKLSSLKELDISYNKFGNVDQSPFPVRCRCIASDCMMWVPETKVNHAIDGIEVTSHHGGCCGLAKP